MYQTVFWDLDGTIFDTGNGIMTCAELTLKELGIAVPSRTELRAFVGPPLTDSFATFGLDRETCIWARDRYREHYAVHGLEGTEPYPGVPALLAEVQAAGLRQYITTSKSEDFARLLLERFECIQYFDGVVAASLDGSLSEKEDIIREALCRNGIEAATCVMVGDRKFDIEGAKANGLDSIAVLYGYGSREEFEQYRPKYVVQNAEELRKLLLGARA